MRKLVIILIVFLAVVTFIRAFDHSETTLLDHSSETYAEPEEFDMSVPENLQF